MRHSSSLAALWLLLSLGLLLAHACSQQLTASEESAVDFESDIRPVIAARCLTCHGADEPEADLDLTHRSDSAITALNPGEPDQSELLRRIVSQDSSDRMPPSGNPLTPQEIEAVEQWIAQGAEWPEHWAYRPLSEPVLAAPIDSAWRVRTSGPIDAAINRELVRLDLHPVEPTSQVTLLRRLTFDLHGLPPDPQAVREIANDSRPDAIARVVDRLLASPRYGERQARHWIDLVHFAETHGHDQDRPRDNAWPYRDWLIQRFNEDVPYRQLVVEQIAGDVIESDDPWSIVGTGMLAAGPWDESSLRDIREDAPDREVARYLDRDDIVTNVMSTFSATSMHCARCHDHKFDPITQRDHYGLQAIFASTDKAERTVDLNPEIAQQRRDLTARLQNWQTFDAMLADELPESIEPSWVAQQTQQFTQQLSAWQSLTPQHVVSLGGATPVMQEDQSVSFTGPRPDKDTYRFEFSLADSMLAGKLTGVRLEVLDDPALPAQGPGRCDNGNLHLTELRILTRGAADASWTEHSIMSAVADFDQTGWTAAHCIDGNPNTAWGIFPEVGKPHQLVFTLAQPIELAGPASQLKIEAIQAHGGSHLIGRARVSITDQDQPAIDLSAAPPATIRALLVKPEAERTIAESLELVRWLTIRELSAQVAALPPLDRVYCGTNRYQADGSFRPSLEPRLVNVLNRGLVDSPIEPATPSVFENLADRVPYELPADKLNDEGARRLALAEWLTASSQPLTWRVMANRLWLQHFGQAIVTTPNDFGRMGATPSHPQLLDWLAVRLRDDESMKNVQRRMVLSDTYRRSSQRNEHALAIDSQAKYLWRVPSRRLDAESFSDSLLVVSGAIDWKMSGPSVRQYIQSPGIHVTPLVNYEAMPITDVAHRRRAIYRFLFRTIPDPLFDALDCPDASQLTPQRNESLTAVQALATLNGRQTAIAAERLAERLEQEVAEESERVDWLFERLFARQARAAEREQIAGFAQEHGWPAACRVLLNTNEFLFVD